MHNNLFSSLASNSRYLRFVFIFISTGFLFTSCLTAKNTYYFKSIKRDTTITNFVTSDLETKIAPGDNISIVVTSLSKDEDIIFNQAAGEVSDIAGLVAGTPGFLVRPNGTVLLHRLGDTKAAGFTRKEFALQLQKDLLPYMKDPIVNVNYINHKVTVLGAVNKPQVLNLQGEQLPLLDVLVASGDISTAGKHSDVMIIREEGTTKKVKHLDLENQSIFNSPWYYVQNNDIVYVVPDKEKADRLERRISLRTTLSLVASSVSLLIIIIDRLLK